METAVSELADSHRNLQAENAKIRRQLVEANRRVRTLDGELLAANQRRQDTSKRIDELIAHLDQLDSQLDEQERESGTQNAAEPSIDRAGAAVQRDE